MCMTITLYEEEELAASDLFYAICILRIKKPHKQEEKNPFTEPV